MPRKMSLINHAGSLLMKEVLDMNVIVRRPLHRKPGDPRVHD